MSGNKSYSAQDIKLYLEGRLSPEEMHALERAALEDPFLADALEGMQQHGDTEKFFAETQGLKERIGRKARAGSRAAVVPIFWKAAAVLLIVVSGVALIIYMGEGNKQAGVEVAKTEERRSAPAVAKINDMKQADSEVTAASPQARKQLFKQNSAKKTDAPAQSPADSEVVAAYGLSRKSPAFAEVAATIKIAPQPGWPAFNKYIDSCKNVSLLDSFVRGTEEIEFDIDQSGRPANIKIVRSLSPAHDEQVIRWLIAGPSWMVSSESQQRITIPITF